MSLFTLTTGWGDELEMNEKLVMCVHNWAEGIVILK